ncbi:hypothetical protein [uncultured Mediterranean phage]|nr:hypothetical protein [uncultured Mediterranean phage]
MDMIKSWFDGLKRQKKIFVIALCCLAIWIILDKIGIF